MVGSARGLREGLTTKEHRRTFRGDRNVLHQGHGNSYAAVLICQNPSNCSLNLVHFIVN